MFPQINMNQICKSIKLKEVRVFSQNYKHLHTRINCESVQLLITELSNNQMNPANLKSSSVVGIKNNNRYFSLLNERRVTIELSLNGTKWKPSFNYLQLTFHSNRNQYELRHSTTIQIYIEYSNIHYDTCASIIGIFIIL